MQNEEKLCKQVVKISKQYCSYVSVAAATTDSLTIQLFQNTIKIFKECFVYTYLGKFLHTAIIITRKAAEAATQIVCESHQFTND